MQGRINHGAKRAMAQPPPAAVRGPLATKNIFLGYLIVIYIGNQITSALVIIMSIGTKPYFKREAVRGTAGIGTRE